MLKGCKSGHCANCCCCERLPEVRLLQQLLQALTSKHKALLALLW